MPYTGVDDFIKSFKQEYHAIFNTDENIINIPIVMNLYGHQSELRQSIAEGQLSEDFFNIGIVV